MGLDFPQCGAHWSYSGFNRFRRRIAEMLGLDWDTMVGKGMDRPCKDSAEYKNMWARASEHPVYPLLNHSDCDGELGPAECRLVARGLQLLAPNWRQDDPAEDHDRKQAKLLAAGCLAAAEANEPLEFR